MMIKKRLFAAILACALLMISIPVWAAELSGKVFSKGAPVANLTVAVKGSDKKARTDANGEYKLDLAPGEHTLIIRGREYAVVVKNEPTKHDIQLQ